TTSCSRCSTPSRCPDRRPTLFLTDQGVGFIEIEVDMAFSDRKVMRKESIPLSFVVEMLRTKVQMDVTPLNDVPLESRLVVEHTIHRPGLVLAGYDELFQYQRVQILGNT